MRAYTKSGINVESIADLRWLLFSKYGYEIATLPPTTGALKYRIFRSHYVALVLKKCSEPTQNLPDPVNFGWELENGNLVPIMTVDLPAPSGLIELSMCSCKTSCETNRCSCRRNKLLCTDMCKCGDNCENVENGDIEYISDGEEEDLELDD